MTSGASLDIRIKRAYEAAADGDGYRVLADRLWPRGVSAREARLDTWEKDLGPSNALRQWFGHEPARFDEFRRRYAEELDGKEAALTSLRDVARGGPLTLVYGAADREHNNAVVLADLLRGDRRERGDGA